MTVIDDELTDTGAETDQILRAIADEDRRFALAHLCDADGPIGVQHLAETLVSDGVIEPSTDVDATDPETAVAASLAHRHLPVLDEASLVSYDHETSVVEADIDRADLEGLTALLPDEYRDGN